MKQFISTIVTFLFFISGINAQNLITVEDIWSKYAFYPQAAGGFNVMKDGMHYTDLETDGNFQNLVKFDLKTGKKITTLVNGADVKVGDKTIDISG